MEAENRFIDGIKHEVFLTKAFGNWGKINMLRMFNSLHN